MRLKCCFIATPHIVEYQMVKPFLRGREMTYRRRWDMIVVDRKTGELRPR
jgi:hypothetical protein